MIFPNPKKVATVIVNRIKPKGGYSEGGEVVEPKEEEHDEPEAHGMHSAMEDLLSAMHEKSPKGMHEALSNWHDQYKVNEPVDEMETPEDKTFTEEHKNEYAYPNR